MNFFKKNYILKRNNDNTTLLTTTYNESRSFKMKRISAKLKSQGGKKENKRPASHKVEKKIAKIFSESRKEWHHAKVGPRQTLSCHPMRTRNGNLKKSQKLAQIKDQCLKGVDVSSLEHAHLQDFFEELNYLFVNTQQLEKPTYTPVLTAHPSWARIRNFNLIKLVFDLLNESESMENLGHKVRMMMRQDSAASKPTIDQEIQIFKWRIEALQCHYPGLKIDIWCDFDRVDMNDQKQWEPYLEKIINASKNYVNVNIQLRLPSEKLDWQRVQKAIKTPEIGTLVIANFTQDTQWFNDNHHSQIPPDLRDKTGFALADALGNYINQQRIKQGLKKCDVFPLLEDPQSMVDFVEFLRNKIEKETGISIKDIAEAKKCLSFLIMHACSDMGPYGLYGQCLTMVLDSLGAGADFMGEGNSALRQVFFSLKHVIMKTVQGTYGNQALTPLKNPKKDQNRDFDFKLIGRLCKIDKLRSEADFNVLKLSDYMKIIKKLNIKAGKAKTTFDDIAKKFLQAGLGYKAGSRADSVAAAKANPTLESARAIGKVWAASQLHLTGLWMLVDTKDHKKVQEWINEVNEERLIPLFERLKGPCLIFDHLKKKYKGVDDCFLQSTFPEHYEVYKQAYPLYKSVKDALVKTGNFSDEDLKTPTKLESKLWMKGLRYLKERAPQQKKRKFSQIDSNDDARCNQTGLQAKSGLDVSSNLSYDRNWKKN